MDRSGLTLDRPGSPSAGSSRVMLRPGSNTNTAITAAAPAAAIPTVTLRLMPLGFGDRGRNVLGAGVLGSIFDPLAVEGQANGLIAQLQLDDGKDLVDLDKAPVDAVMDGHIPATGRAGN